jgi:hypothetical protein
MLTRAVCRVERVGTLSGQCSRFWLATWLAATTGRKLARALADEVPMELGPRNPGAATRGPALQVESEAETYWKKHRPAKREG